MAYTHTGTDLSIRAYTQKGKKTHTNSHTHPHSVIVQLSLTYICKNIY